MTLTDLTHVHDALHDQLGRHGASVATILSCPHERDSCTCRKPKIGLLRQAARYVGLPLIDAVVIGDSESDVVAGARAGTTTIRIAEPSVDTVADFIVPSLPSAVDLVVGARAP